MGFIMLEEEEHRLLHPRPAYIVVSGSVERANLMAVSWLAPVSEEPPRLVMGIAKDSYTLKLIKETGEFTVNVVSEDKVDLIWAAGTMSGWRVDKVRELGVALEPSLKVKAPHLKDAIGVVEARVHKLLDSGDTMIVIADMVAAYASPDYYDERYGWDIRKARIPLHLGGKAFTVPGRLVVAGRRRTPH